MIYMGQRWAPVLLNYVCYWCFAPLRLRGGRPDCYFHRGDMWLHKDRRDLFRQLRRTVQAQERRRELLGAF
jgi:hypothetical protein